MESNEFMVSVRLMTYNHARFIRQAMDGIMMQKTTFSVEVVVGDDFSQDETLHIIGEYTPTNKIFIHILDRKEGGEYWKKRQELGRLYNFANILSHCKGKYVALLDGDDYWTDPYKLQKQVDFLEANQDFVACYHPVTVVDEKGMQIRNSKNSFLHNRDVTANELILGRVLSMLSLCFRNVIHEFPDEFYRSPTGDNFLCSLLGNYGQGKYLVSVEPSAYRLHTNGIWSLQDLEKKRMTLVLSYFWLWQYYLRIGKPEFAKGFYQRILLEGFYSDPFKIANVPAFLAKSELLIIKSTRRFFRLMRRLFM